MRFITLAATLMLAGGCGLVTATPPTAGSVVSNSPPTFAPTGAVATIGCNTMELTRVATNPNPCTVNYLSRLTMAEFNGNTDQANNAWMIANYTGARYVMMNGGTPAAKCQFIKYVLANVSSCICPPGCQDQIWNTCANMTDDPYATTQGGRFLINHAKAYNTFCNGVPAPADVAMCKAILPEANMAQHCDAVSLAPTTPGEVGTSCAFPVGAKRSGMCIDNYQGRCSFLTGPRVFIGETTTVQTVDEAVRRGLAPMRLPSLISLECQLAWDRLICDAAYPRCTSATFGDPAVTEILPRPPCQSTCLDVWQKCHAIIKAYAASITDFTQSFIPNCGINGTFDAPHNQPEDVNGGRPKIFPWWFGGAAGLPMFPAVDQEIVLYDGISTADVTCFNVSEDRPNPGNQLVDVSSPCGVFGDGGFVRPPPLPFNITRPPTLLGQVRPVVYVCGGGGDPHYLGGNATHPFAFRAGCQAPGWQLFAATPWYEVEVYHQTLPGASVSVISAMRISAFAPATTRLYFGDGVDDWATNNTLSDDDSKNYTLLFPTVTDTEHAVIIRGRLMELRFGCNTWTKDGNSLTVCNIAMMSPDIVAGICRMGCPGQETVIVVVPPGGNVTNVAGRRQLDAAYAAYNDSNGNTVYQVQQQAACIAAGLQEPFLSNCHFDGSVSNDTAFFVQQSLLGAASFNSTSASAVVTATTLSQNNSDAVGLAAKLWSMVVVFAVAGIMSGGF